MIVSKEKVLAEFERAKAQSFELSDREIGAQVARKFGLPTDEVLAVVEELQKERA